MLNGSLSEAEEDDVANLLNLDATEEYRVITFYLKPECYLNQKQSIRKTSELMNIHARTVSYRLQKIVKLTGMNFDNIAEMLAVRNGIIILKILEQL